MNKLGDFFYTNWVRMLIVAGVLLVSYILLFHGIESMTGGRYNPREFDTLQSASSVKDVWQNPINAPYKLILIVLGELQSDWGVLAARVTSALFAVVSTLLFYWCAANIFSRRVAFLATPLFIFSTFLLHAARYGEPFIIQLAPLLLLGGILLYQRSRHPTVALYVLAALFGLSLYSPGAIWFLILGIVLLWPTLRRFGRLHDMFHIYMALLVLVIVLVPIAFAGIRDQSSLLQYVALPDTLPTWPSIVENLKLLGEALVYRSYYSPTIALHGAPLLNIAEIALLIAGLIALATHPRLRSSYFILVGLLIAAVLLAIGGGAALTMLTPFIYLTIAAGIFLLLDQWLTVFPRNPVARTLGVVLCAVVIGFSVLHHARAYYVAWPNAPETKEALNIERTAVSDILD